MSVERQGRLVKAAVSWRGPSHGVRGTGELLLCLCHSFEGRFDPNSALSRVWRALFRVFFLLPPSCGCAGVHRGGDKMVLSPKQREEL